MRCCASKWIVGAIVLCVHLLPLIGIPMGILIDRGRHKSPPNPPTPKRIVVRNYMASERAAPTTTQTHSHLRKKPLHAKWHTKKRAPRPTSKKASKQSVQPVKRADPPPPPCDPVIPQCIEMLQVDGMQEREAARQVCPPSSHYLLSLRDILHTHLTLPEKGSARIRLTVAHTGSVEKIEVLYADGEKIKEYLQEALPPLKLPPFSGEFSGEFQGVKQHTFTLCFQHE